MSLPFSYKFTNSPQLNLLNQAYLNCIASNIKELFSKNDLPDEELCLEEKEKFYNLLHEENRVEHDNLMRFYTNNIGKSDI